MERARPPLLSTSLVLDSLSPLNPSLNTYLPPQERLRGMRLGRLCAQEEAEEEPEHHERKALLERKAKDVVL